MALSFGILALQKLGPFSFHEWLKSEHRDIHFSVASLLSSLFCLLLFYAFVYRHKTKIRSIEPIHNGDALG